MKSIKFKDHKYVGDPINAVKIFNEKEVDEIVILDISATEERRGPNVDVVRDITSEAFMPVAYGGGITTMDQISQLIFAGVEKVILNNTAYTTPRLLTEAAKVLGSQSIVASIDVKKNLFGKASVRVQNGKKDTSINAVEYAKRMEEAGVGEILLNSIDRDGTYSGYDLTLIHEVASAVAIPVVAIGGAGSVDDMARAVKSGASAVSAGSMFVFQRPHNAVLISYPSQKELMEKVFNTSE